jgi:hypothetical protein
MTYQASPDIIEVVSHAAGRGCEGGVVVFRCVVVRGCLRFTWRFPVELLRWMLSPDEMPGSEVDAEFRGGRREWCSRDVFRALAFAVEVGWRLGEDVLLAQRTSGRDEAAVKKCR